MPLTTTQQTEAYRFFAIAFNAAPGVEYMNQIAAAYEGGASTKQIVNTFTTKSVFTNLYPNFLTNEQFAARLIDNVVGAAATDAAKTEAKADVVAALAAGSSRGDVIFQIFTNLSALTGDAKWGDMATKMANQVAVSRYYTETLLKTSTDVATLQAVLAGVNQSTDITTAALEARLNPAPVDAARSFTLTAGLDNFTGGSGNDTFNSLLATGVSALDTLDGGAGTDTINIFGLNSAGAAADVSASTSATVKNIEVANITGAAAVTVDASGWTGLTNLNLKQAVGNVSLTAGSTAAVDVANATGGTIAVIGGSTQTVAVGTAGGNVSLTKAAGAVALTVTSQGTNTLTVENGTSVSVTSAMAAVNGGSITVGGAAASTRPSGAVTVANTATNSAVASVASGAVTVNGGSSVTVTQSAAQAALTSGTAANFTLTQGAVNVNGSAATTTVTVSQTKDVASAGRTAAVAGATESNTVTFGALTAGQTLELSGLTFTAGTAGTTAAQTAAAFANLASGAIAGASILGSYSGKVNGWSTGAVSGTSSNVLTFTSTTANSNVGDLTAGGTNAAAGTVVKVADGSAATAGVAGNGGTAAGVVTIADVSYGTATANTIATVSVNGYGAGSAVSSNALTSLSLSNSANSFNVNNNTATTLALTLNGVTGAVNLDAAAAKYTTLNVTATGASSSSVITAAAVKTLTVAGDKVMTIGGASTLSALQTVSVSGTAGLTATLSGATVTAVDTSATTGTATVTIDGSKATYTGGAGVDKVTLSSATVSKAIALGDGDDNLILAAGTTASSAAVAGGAGTDTLTMDVGNAATASGTDAFAGKFSGFEILGLTGDAGTIDLAVLGAYSRVSSAATGAVTLNKLPSTGTLTVTAANTGGYTVAVTDAATGTTDVLNLALSSSASLAAGSVTAANVETVNVTSTDTDTTSANANSLTVAATASTGMTLSGNAALTLTTTSTKLTSVNASAMTAGLTYTSTAGQAVTVTGGSGADRLVAATGTVAHTFDGGAGADTLTSNAGLSVLTGGAGNDTFIVSSAGANVNVYTTIADAAAGDRLVLVNQGTESFSRTKLTLGDTAVFQDYANLAAAGDGSTNGAISWFQFAGNTYIVMDRSAANTFQGGTDLIVKLAGLVDVSTAIFSNAGSAITGAPSADAAVLVFG